MDYTEKIKGNLNNCLTETDLDFGIKKVGKVRDTYELADKIILITTDRQSAFDRILASIPFKGQVLNQTSAWWFKKTRHIVSNHVIDVPDPNVTVAKKCKVFPVEFVVRGYITGTTNTSAWVNYQNGVRNFCGNELPEGMKKNQKFYKPIITPTTKSDEHDESVSAKQIVERGLMTKEDWNYVSEKALELFRFGQATSQQHGLILVDTKYEFGKAEDGTIMLIDEIHTPDSSRYWIEKTYEERFENGLEPENIDKEFLRLWFKQNCDPYNDPELPDAPEELVIELSKRYIQLYEMITRQTFEFPENSGGVKARIEHNFQTNLKKTMLPKKSPISIPTGLANDKQIKVVLVLGSDKDKSFASKITEKLEEFGIKFDQHIASAHKQAREGLDLIEKYKNEKIIYVTIAGRSNALSGFFSGNSDKPVIACPPFKDKLEMMININSTLQMPSSVPVLTILDPKNCALAITRLAKSI